MKKRLLRLLALLTVGCIGALLFFSSSAGDTERQTVILSRDITMRDDGSQVVTDIRQAVPAPGDDQTVTGCKSYRLESATGETIWNFTLYATFAYGSGGPAVCTEAWYTYEINDSGWKLRSAEVTPSGDRAEAHAAMDFDFLIFTTYSMDVDLELKCSSTGMIGQY